MSDDPAAQAPQGAPTTEDDPNRWVPVPAITLSEGPQMTGWYLVNGHGHVAREADGTTVLHMRDKARAEDVARELMRMGYRVGM